MTKSKECCNRTFQPGTYGFTDICTDCGYYCTSHNYPESSKSQVTKMNCPKCGNKMIEWFDHQVFKEMHCSNCGFDCQPTAQVTKMEWKEELRKEFEDKFTYRGDEPEFWHHWNAEPGKYPLLVLDWFLSKLTLSESRVRVQRELEVIDALQPTIELFFKSYFPDEDGGYLTVKFFRLLNDSLTKKEREE